MAQPKTVRFGKFRLLLGNSESPEVYSAPCGFTEITVTYEKQVSEVLPIEHTTFVGTIPSEIQYVTTYAAAVVAGSANADAARKLVAFLSSPAAAPAIQKSGMEPVNVH